MAQIWSLALQQAAASICYLSCMCSQMCGAVSSNLQGVGQCQQLYVIAGQRRHIAGFTSEPCDCTAAAE